MVGAGGVARVGIVGCGAIAPVYLDGLDRLPGLRLTAVADLRLARARRLAKDRPNVRALTVKRLIADRKVDVVLNLTVPQAHAEISLAAVEAGKSVYSEKPIAHGVGLARQVLTRAHIAKIRVGSAPDTVLGTGTQTARKAIDDGMIGMPTAATATMITPGHERWHPDPEFYYQPGGGPLMDMGPYYVTALVTLLGPVVSVLAVASKSRSSRTIGSGPRAGERVPVTIDTHVTGVLMHANRVLSTLVMSFDGVATRSSSIEVHGDRGSLTVPDPNTFGGRVRLRTLDSADWQLLEPSAGYRDGFRGIGLADMVETPLGVEPRAGGRLAFHVLDVLESMLASARTRRAVDVTTSCDRPRPLPLTGGG